MRTERDLNAETSWRDRPYWSDKPNPKEQFDIVFEGRKIEVVNFSDVGLTPEQLAELQTIISQFSQIKDGAVFDKIKSIYVDNVQPVDSELPEGVNGRSVESEDGIVTLYPRALQPIPHRVEGVSNFKGTIIHEFAHSIEDSETKERWEQAFGWTVDQEKMKELERTGLKEKLEMTRSRDWGKLSQYYPGVDIEKLTRVWKIKEPKRCINDYAKLSPDDDFCDSFVAAMAETGSEPKKLDYKRWIFMKSRFLSKIDSATASAVDIQRK